MVLLLAENAITNNDDAEILQLHYYLKNNSHSMNALTFNRAESELLKIIEEVVKTFGIDILVESEALIEGGLRANYKLFLKKNSKVIDGTISKLIIPLIVGVISGYGSVKLSADKEMDELNKEKTRLEIQHLKSLIAKNARDSIKDAEDKQIEEEKILTIDSSETEKNNDEINVDTLARFISEKSKIKIHKSAFYRNISNDHKITKVSTQILSSNHEPISDEVVVERKNFSSFILENTKIDDLYLTDVSVEIVAPVIKGTQFKWKGILNGNSITFSMSDEDLRTIITTRGIKFVSGTKMICDIEIKRKLNIDGNIVLGSKNVYNVSQVQYPDGDKFDIIKNEV